MNLSSARNAKPLNRLSFASFRTLCHSLENGPERARRPAAPRRQHVLHLRYPQLFFHVVLVTPVILLVTNLAGNNSWQQRFVVVVLPSSSSQRRILLGTAAGDHVEPAAGAVPRHGAAPRLRVLRVVLLLILLLQHRLEVDALVVLGGDSIETILA